MFVIFGSFPAQIPNVMIDSNVATYSWMTFGPQQTLTITGILKPKQQTQTLVSNMSKIYIMCYKTPVMWSVIVEYGLQCGLSVCHLLSLNVKDGRVFLVM